tara:strand:- start:9145 stop:16611 length:7467 start_codon:yes stop_codon:yes gene_type:complete
MPQQTNLDVSPYFDDYNPADEFHRVLFKPGYPVQARELTTLQSILQNQIEKFGQHFFKDGAKVIPGNTSYNNDYRGIQLNNLYQGIPVAAYVDQLIGTKITGESSGVTAVVNKVLLDQDSENGNLTLYVTYIGSSTANNSTVTFADGEELSSDTTITSGLLGNTAISAGTPFGSTISADAAITGSSFSIQEGVYFVRGQFVQCQTGTLVLDQYSNNPSYRIGFFVNEEIITSDLDESLNDNSQGYNNYSAPGADRLKISLTLFKKSLTDEDDTNFIELGTVTDGVLKTIPRQGFGVGPNGGVFYEDLEDTLARRTYDESGDYYVKPFDVTLRESLNDNIGNRGLYQEGQITPMGGTPSDELMIYKISGGKAYVKGYEVGTPQPTILDAAKPRTTKIIKDEGILYNTGAALKVNRSFGAPIVGVGNTYVLSLQDQRTAANQTTAQGTEIGVARVYDYNLESGSYDAANANVNQWDISLYDVETYVTLTLNEGITLSTPTYIKGTKSGATGFLRTAASATNSLTLYGVNGEFIVEEPLLFPGKNEDGTSVSRVVTAVDVKSINDVKSIFGKVGGGNTFAADVIQSVGSFIGIGSITAASSGLSTITSTNELFPGTLVSVNNLLKFSNTAQSDDPTYGQVTAVGTNTVTIKAVADVNGVVNGNLPTASLQVTDLEVLTTELDASSDDTLFTVLPKPNIATVDNTKGSITIRKKFAVDIENGQLKSNTIPTTGTNETFLPFDEERYILIRSDGTTESLTANQFVFTGGTQLQIYGLGSDDQDATLLTAITKLKPTSKEKIKDRVNSIVVTKSTIGGSGINTSGIGNTTLNDGLEYGNYPWGTRVQDEVISLNTPDIIKVHGIFESSTTGDASAPTAVLSSLTSASTTTEEFIVGEQIVGQTSGAIAIVAEKLTASQISFIYENEKVFIEGEIVAAKESLIQGNVTTLESTSYDISKEFTYDSGQEGSFYNYGFLIRNSGVDAPTHKLKIYFMSASYDSTDTGDVTTVESYRNFNYSTEIPSVNGIRNSDIIDIRPRVSTYTVAENSRSPLEFDGRTFNGAGNSAGAMLQSDGSILTTYSYYQGRIDRIFANKEGVFQVVYGTPSDNPSRPLPVDDAIEIATVSLPPYLYDVSQSSIKFLEYKRYQMQDIHKLDTRIKNLEYYTALSLLETNTSNMFVSDSDGLNRFKSGFFVDNFSSFVAQETSEGVKNSIDPKRGELRASHYTTSIDLMTGPVEGVIPDQDKNFTTPEGVNIRKDNGIITLDYSEIEWIKQVFGTRTESVTPYVVSYWAGSLTLNPESDTWVDQTRLEARVINREGNFAETVAELSRTRGFDPQNGFGQTVWNSWETFWTGVGREVEEQHFIGNVRWSRRGNFRIGERVLARANFRDVENRQRRTGARMEVREQFDTVSQGDRTISRSLIPFMRSRNIEFSAKSLKPLTRIYAFFDSQSVSEFCVPKLIEINMIDGTFQVGETVRGVNLSNNSAGTGASNLITFRVAQANHREGEYNLPTKTYPDNPYTLQPLSSEYSSTSTLLNVDTFSLANINQPEYSGYVQNQMILVGQSSGAQARVSNVRMVSDITSALQGSFFIPDTTVNPSAPRFETGNKLFRLTSDEENGLGSSTRGEEEYRAEGFHDVVQETIISTRNATVELNELTEERSQTRREQTTAWTNTNNWQTMARQRVGGDPLAQTFTVDDNTGIFITKCDVFFRTKDDMDVPVNFSIRTVVNGIPTTKMVPETEVILDPSDVNVSSDGSFATTFQFKSPVYLEPEQEYAIVLLSNSAKYEVYISRVGENDLITDSFVGQQPFLGSLFKSQNASTWEPSQWEDLKFTLYRADFLSDGTVEFYNPELSSGNGQVPLLEENSLSFTSRQSRVGLGTTIADGGLRVGNVVIQAGTNATGNLAGFAGTAIGLNIINPGIGYTPSSGTLGFTGVNLVTVTGGGRGATANITVTDGVIANAVITGTGGGGYQIGDVVGFNTLGVAAVGRNARLSIVSIGNTNEIILDQIQGNFAVGAAQTLSYINNSGITTELNFENGLGGDVQVTSNNVISDGLHVKVNHKNHGMYSHENKVTLSGAISDIKPTKLNVAYNVDSTGGISVSDPSQFLEFENVGVGTTNAGYLKIENEILEYQSVSGNLINITGARGSDKFNYPVGTPVYKYELNGVSLHRINRTHDVLSVPDIDFESYNIKIDMSDEGVDRTVAGYPLLYAGKTKSTGGVEVRATQNIPFEIITPVVDNITLPRTTLTAEVRTTTGISIDGDEDQWLDEGFESVSINETNYLETPRLIGSKVNADEYLTQVKGKKSLNLRLALSSGDSRISPVVDSTRINTILTSNNINQPITDYANDSRVNSLTDDPNACQYVSQEMMLENAASSIKILLDAHVNENADIRAFYAINSTEGKVPIFVPFPGYSNINRKGEIIDKRNNDGKSDKKVIKSNTYAFEDVDFTEYTFSVDNLPSFKTYRIKLVMTSTSQVHVPRVKDLRVLALA